MIKVFNVTNEEGEVIVSLSLEDNNVIIKDGYNVLVDGVEVHDYILKCPSKDLYPSAKTNPEIFTNVEELTRKALKEALEEYLDYLSK